MSGISAKRTLPWELVDFDASELYQTVEKTVYDSNGQPVMVNQTTETGETVKDDDGNPVKVEKRIKIIQARSQYVMTISRRLFGVNSFGEQVGESRNSWSLQTGPASAINYTSTSKKWVCTKDRLEQIDMTIGEVRQTQAWMYMSKWRTVEDGKFE